MSEKITISTQKHFINFQIELLSPLIHTEEVASNVATFYRQKYLKNSKAYMIPTMRGNAMRGLMRRCLMSHLLDTIEIYYTQDSSQQSLDVDTAYALLGGALTGSESLFNMHETRKLRDLLPALSIFGSALGDRMLQGKIEVGCAYPECKELETGELSVYDLMDNVRHIRIDDMKLIFGDDYVDRAKKEIKLNKKGEIIDDKAQMMFYDIEVMSKGAILNWSVSIDSKNKMEYACLARALKQLQEFGYLGGKSSAGYGQFKFLESVEKMDSTLYDQHLEDSKEEIKEFLVTKGFKL